MKSTFCLPFHHSSSKSALTWHSIRMYSPPGGTVKLGSVGKYIAVNSIGNVFELEASSLNVVEVSS